MSDLVLILNSENDRLRDLCRAALLYLEHPDVEAIPFAMPASVVAARIRAAINQEEESYGKVS